MIAAAAAEQGADRESPTSGGRSRPAGGRQALPVRDHGTDQVLAAEERGRGDVQEMEADHPPEQIQIDRIHLRHLNIFCETVMPSMVRS